MSLCDPKTAKNQELKPCNTHSLQRGSAIIWIFVMIAIMAALYYVVSSGSRSGASNLSKEKADLAATEILDYAQSIKQAVQTLQINGCNDTEISFENNTVSGYTNPNSPSDNSCHVFHPNGGGLQWIKPSEEISNGRDFFFDQANGLSGISDRGQLVLELANIPGNVCSRINEQLALNDAYLTGTHSAQQYNGTYAPTASFTCTPNCEPTFCIQSSNWTEQGENLGNTNIFMQVLIRH